MRPTCKIHNKVNVIFKRSTFQYKTNATTTFIGRRRNEFIRLFNGFRRFIFDGFTKLAYSMNLIAYCITIVALSFSLSAHADAVREPSSLKERDSQCEEKVAIPPVFDAAQVIFFGEIHGTQESPKLVTDVLCDLLTKGHTVLLGVEIPSNEQARLDTYMHGNGTKDELEKMLNSPFWTSNRHDGRSSQAVLSLIEMSRVLAKATTRLRVIAFAPYQQEANFDESMANVVQASINKNSREKILILTGNYHASRSVGTLWDPSFKPMAYYFKNFNTVSIRIEHRRGSAWNCVPTCGVQNLLDDVEKSKQPLGFTVFNELINGFDAEYLNESASASFPAVRNRENNQ